MVAITLGSIVKLLTLELNGKDPFDYNFFVIKFNEFINKLFWKNSIIILCKSKKPLWLKLNTILVVSSLTTLFNRNQLSDRWKLFRDNFSIACNNSMGKCAP